MCISDNVGFFLKFNADQNQNHKLLNKGIEHQNVRTNLAFIFLASILKSHCRKENWSQCYLHGSSIAKEQCHKKLVLLLNHRKYSSCKDKEIMNNKQKEVSQTFSYHLTHIAKDIKMLTKFNKIQLCSFVYFIV